MGSRAENLLPLENKAVVSWRLGPTLKATNPVTPENYVLTGPVSASEKMGPTLLPLPRPTCCERPRPVCGGGGGGR